MNLQGGFLAAFGAAVLIYGALNTEVEARAERALLGLLGLALLIYGVWMI
jgi:hypothetical protein